MNSRRQSVRSQFKGYDNIRLFTEGVVPIISLGRSEGALRAVQEEAGLDNKPKVLCVGDIPVLHGNWLESLRKDCEVVEVQNPLRALARLTSEKFDGVFVDQEHLRGTLKLGHLLQSERILESMPDGLVVLDESNTIIWANNRIRSWSKADKVVGLSFYEALGSPEILGPDYCPLRSAIASGQASTSTLRTDENQYFHVHAAPVLEEDNQPHMLIVTVHDVSVQMQQQQKLEAIHKAGIELADLTAEELFKMDIGERIELLKSDILKYTRDLLSFDVVEIRLMNQKTGRLDPLLSVGIDGEAASRDLFARPQANGVTGFVAATGKSYLCEDTTEDPLYIVGFKGAKSSMTVPLSLHDQVIGTFNVESPEPRAFSESDLQFLEIFSREVAIALNTLELLVAQQANTAQASVEAIHRAVALPVDEILNDAVNVMETYIGHDTDVLSRLKRILRNARDIKEVIQQVGQKMTPEEAVPQSAQVKGHPSLRDRHVLVVDSDDGVRDSAHALLERYSCVVETAHEGSEAVFMVRNSETAYDAIIADINLPDMTGYDLLLKLKNTIDPVPLILMTGFGYDPMHTIVSARKEGLAAVLYKPFRLDQLLDIVETTIGKV